MAGDLGQYFVLCILELEVQLALEVCCRDSGDSSSGLVLCKSVEAEVRQSVYRAANHAGEGEGGRDSGSGGGGQYSCIAAFQSVAQDDRVSYSGSECEILL